MDPGTYTILLELDSPRHIEFGAAGMRHLEAGFYAYTGSAFGPGGLSRIDRHRRVATGRNPTRHWHIDHLLGTEESRFVDVWTAPNEAVECEVAGAIDAQSVDGIGATDCSCSSHLHVGPERDPLVGAIETVYD